MTSTPCGRSTVLARTAIIAGRLNTYENVSITLSGSANLLRLTAESYFRPAGPAHALAAPAADIQHVMAVFLAKVGDVRPAGFEERDPSKPSIAINAKSLQLPDCRAALNRASNCRCSSPGLGDSAGAGGRPTS